MNSKELFYQDQDPSRDFCAIFFPSFERARPFCMAFVISPWCSVKNQCFPSIPQTFSNQTRTLFGSERNKRSWKDSLSNFLKYSLSSLSLSLPLFSLSLSHSLTLSLSLSFSLSLSLSLPSLSLLFLFLSLQTHT
jgi:hypothetical protein